MKKSQKDSSKKKQKSSSKKNFSFITYYNCDKKRQYINSYF